MGLARSSVAWNLLEISYTVLQRCQNCDLAKALRFQSRLQDNGSDAFVRFLRAVVRALVAWPQFAFVVASS
jgi:hypothetical protein